MSSPMERLAPSSKEEVSKLIAHCGNLIIKDQDLADSLETQESLREAEAYLEVYYQLDKYPAHEKIIEAVAAVADTSTPDSASSSAIKNYVTAHVTDLNTRAEITVILDRIVSRTGELIQASTVRQDLSLLRESYLESFVDKNPYYEGLKSKGVPIWKSRIAEDFDILYELNTKGDQILKNFGQAYREARRYFVSVLYTKALARDAIIGEGIQALNYYKAFCRFSICLMAITKCIDERLKRPIDVDFIDEAGIDQFLYSFGFSEFRDFPVKYKRTIMLRLNRLIQRKGTDAVFVDILNIFDYDEINIITYHLVNKRSDPYVDDPLRKTNQDIRFLARNVKHPSIQEAIKRNDYWEQSFETLTETDPHWYAKSGEIARYEFDQVQSKYFSIESQFDLMKNVLDTAFAMNLLRKIKKEYPERNDLVLYASSISQEAIFVADMLLAAQVLVCDYFGLDDLIPQGQDAAYSIYSFTGKDDSPLNRIIPNVNPDLPTYGQGPAYLLENIGSFEDIDNREYQSIFLSNRDKYDTYMEFVKEKLKVHWTTPEMARSLKNLYSAKFVAKYHLDEYSGYVRYTDYLRDKNLDLALYIEEVKSITDLKNKQEKVLYVLDALTEYVFDIGIRLDRVFSDVIVQYVLRMIQVFKSYTVSLQDFVVIYKWREDPFFKFVEACEMEGQFDAQDRLQAWEQYDFFGWEDFYDTTLRTRERLEFCKENSYVERVEILDDWQQLSLFDAADFAPMEDVSDFHTFRSMVQEKTPIIDVPVTELQNRVDDGMTPQDKFLQNLVLVQEDDLDLSDLYDVTIANESVIHKDAIPMEDPHTFGDDISSVLVDENPLVELIEYGTVTSKFREIGVIEINSNLPHDEWIVDTEVDSNADIAGQFEDNIFDGNPLPPFHFNDRFVIDYDASRASIVETARFKMDESVVVSYYKFAESLLYGDGFIIDNTPQVEGRERPEFEETLHHRVVKILTDGASFGDALIVAAPVEGKGIDAVQFGERTHFDYMTMWSLDRVQMLDDFLVDCQGDYIVDADYEYDNEEEDIDFDCNPERLKEIKFDASRPESEPITHR